MGGVIQMSIPSKHIVVKFVSERYGCTLSNMKRKQIPYHGLSKEKRLVLCTPQSKLHPRGHGWFD